MAWAIVNTSTMSVSMWVAGGVDADGNQLPSTWETLECIPGTIVNLIEYDGVTEYIPPENTILVQVPDGSKIGDTGFTPA